MAAKMADERAVERADKWVVEMGNCWAEPSAYASVESKAGEQEVQRAETKVDETVAWMVGLLVVQKVAEWDFLSAAEMAGLSGLYSLGQIVYLFYHFYY